MTDVSVAMDLYDKFVATRCLGYPTSYTSNDLFLKHHFCLAPTDLKWLDDGVIVSCSYGQISPEQMAQMNERQRAQVGFNRQELTRLQIAPKRLEPRQILWGPIAPDALLFHIPQRIEPSFLKSGVWSAINRIIQADYDTIRNDIIGYLRRRYTDRGKPVPDYARADIPGDKEREAHRQAQRTAIRLFDEVATKFRHLKIDRLTAGRILQFRQEDASIVLSGAAADRLNEALALRR